MTLAIKLAIIAALILSIFIPFGYFLHGERTKKRYKRSIAFNAFSISVLPLNFFYIIFNLPNCGNTEPSPNCSKPDFE